MDEKTIQRLLEEDDRQWSSIHWGKEMHVAELRAQNEELRKEC